MELNQSGSAAPVRCDRVVVTYDDRSSFPDEVDCVIQMDHKRLRDRLPLLWLAPLKDTKGRR